MPAGHRPGRLPLTREDLPDQFTPDALRGLDLSTLRRLSRRGNGILTDDEQSAFDESLRVVRQGTTDRLDQALRRAGRGGSGTWDPELRRSYERTRERLTAQAERARERIPELPATAEPVPDALEPAPADDEENINLAALESEIEQTSETLEILERIASIEQQQLEHHQSQALRDTRGLFFALLVSVAVIVTGVAPLVEAGQHERRVILLWTLLICVVAGIVYAVVRAAQPADDSKSEAE
jgi:hypothetical protein